MSRLVFVFTIVALASAASAARAASDDCRKPYVVPYAEQCTFAYKSLKKDTSPGNLSAAFNACGRAQNVAVSCVTSPDRHLHAIALGALYQDVTQQAEIALFAQQFTVAKALLREKLQILDVVARDGKPGDPAVARQRKETRVDLADAGAGLCMETALAGAGDARTLAHQKKYADLATFLKKKSGEYAGCARQAPSLPKRAYLEYVGIVALEESGRASQAAGVRNAADADYRACIASAGRISSYATPPVRGYLATVGQICRGRLGGKFGVNEPAPIDAPDAPGFRPLTLPKG